MTLPGRRLVAVRHGRTAWNEAGRYQGHADQPLDGTGRAQAAAVAVALAPLGPALVVASDLRRATATAGPLAAAVGLDVVTDPRLREIDVGSWEGLTWNEAAARFPEEASRWQAGEDVARGGGETRTEAGRRAAAAIMEHLDGVAPGSVVVIVSHGVVLRSAALQLLAAGLVVAEQEPAHLGNGTWMDLEVAPG